MSLCRREALFKQISQKARFLLRVLNHFGEASLFVKLVFCRALVGRLIPTQTCLMLVSFMLAKVRSLSFRVIRSRRIVEFTDSRPLISLLHHCLICQTFSASSLHLASVQVSFDARYTLMLVTTRLVQLEFVYVEFLFVCRGAAILDRHGVLRLLEPILVIEGHIPLTGIPLRFLLMGTIEHAETVPGCVQRGSLLHWEAGLRRIAIPLLTHNIWWLFVLCNSFELIGCAIMSNLIKHELAWLERFRLCRLASIECLIRPVIAKSVTKQVTLDCDLGYDIPFARRQIVHFVRCHSDVSLANGFAALSHWIFLVTML